jgi:hypothetical protein
MSNEISEFMDDFTNYLLLARLSIEFPEQWEKFLAEFKVSGKHLLYLLESEDCTTLTWFMSTQGDYAALLYPKAGST